MVGSTIDQAEVNAFILLRALNKLVQSGRMGAAPKSQACIGDLLKAQLANDLQEPVNQHDNTKQIVKQSSVLATAKSKNLIERYRNYSEKTLKESFKNPEAKESSIGQLLVAGTRVLHLGKIFKQNDRFRGYLEQIQLSASEARQKIEALRRGKAGLGSSSETPQLATMEQSTRNAKARNEVNSKKQPTAPPVPRLSGFGFGFGSGSTTTFTLPPINSISNTPRVKETNRMTSPLSSTHSEAESSFHDDESPKKRKRNHSKTLHVGKAHRENNDEDDDESDDVLVRVRKRARASTSPANTGHGGYQDKPRTQQGNILSNVTGLVPESDKVESPLRPRTSDISDISDEQTRSSERVSAATNTARSKSREIQERGLPGIQVTGKSSGNKFSDGTQGVHVYNHKLQRMDPGTPRLSSKQQSHPASSQQTNAIKASTGVQTDSVTAEELLVLRGGPRAALDTTERVMIWAALDLIGLSVGPDQACGEMKSIHSRIIEHFDDGCIFKLIGPAKGARPIARHLINNLLSTVTVVLGEKSRDLNIEELYRQVEIFLLSYGGNQGFGDGDRVIMESIFTAFLFDKIFSREEILPELGMPNDKGPAVPGLFEAFTPPYNYRSIPEDPWADAMWNRGLHQRRRRQRLALLDSDIMKQRITDRAIKLADEFASATCRWTCSTLAEIQQKQEKMCKDLTGTIEQCLRFKSKLELGSICHRFIYPHCGQDFDDDCMMTGAQQDLLGKHGGMPIALNQVRLTHRMGAWFRTPKHRDDAIKEWWEHKEVDLEPWRLAWAADVTCFEGDVEKTKLQRRHESTIDRSTQMI